MDNSKSKGTNALIKKFAKIATSPNDIIENFKFLRKKKSFGKRTNFVKNLNDEENSDEISEEYKDVYKVITNTPININDIVKLCNDNLKDIMPKLTILELEGRIKKISGNRYIKIDGGRSN